MDLRTPYSRVHHLGSAKSGLGHWWWQRVTAVILVPLLIWFILSLVCLAGADYVTTVAWFKRPLVSAAWVVLLGALFYHAQLGLQVVIEDYVHTELLKIAALLAVKFFTFLLGAAAIIAVLRVAIGA